MPSPAAVGRLSSIATARLTEAAQRIASVTGVPVPDPKVKKAAGPVHQAALMLDRLATWAESLADKIAPKPVEPAKEESSPATEAPAENLAEQSPVEEDNFEDTEVTPEAEGLAPEQPDRPRRGRPRKNPQ